MPESIFGARPLPPVQPESELYWQKLREREIWLRRCTACQHVYFYPRDICPACFSRATEWIKSRGDATLYAFTIVHSIAVPAFRSELPYVAALVELEGGARIPTNLVEIEPHPAAVRIGMPLEPVFIDATDAVTLLCFRPTSPREIP